VSTRQPDQAGYQILLTKSNQSIFPSDSHSKSIPYKTASKSTAMPLKQLKMPGTTNPYTPDSFRPLLKRLVETPEYFTSSDLVHALNHLFTPNTLNPEQIGSFLTALHIHRVERRPESLAAAAQVLRERSLKAQIDGMEGDFIVDIVGTGGDGHNLFNVSTTAGIVAAGAGARVIKVRFLQSPSDTQNNNIGSTVLEHQPLPLALQTSCKPSDAYSLHHLPYPTTVQKSTQTPLSTHPIQHPERHLPTVLPIPLNKIKIKTSLHPHLRLQNQNTPPSHLYPSHSSSHHTTTPPSPTSLRFAELYPSEPCSISLAL